MNNWVSYKGAEDKLRTSLSLILVNSSEFVDNLIANDSYWS